MANFELQVAIAEFIETMFPDDDVQQAKANAAAIEKDGTVNTGAIRASLPWSRADVTIPGSVTVGSDVRHVPFPQGGRIRHVSIYTRTAPTSIFSIRLTSGAQSLNFGLQPGERSDMVGAGMSVTAGAWLVVDVTSAGGAADVEITIHYTPGGIS